METSDSINSSNFDEIFDEFSYLKLESKLQYVEVNSDLYYIIQCILFNKSWENDLLN